MPAPCPGTKLGPAPHGEHCVHTGLARPVPGTMRPGHLQFLLSPALPAPSQPPHPPTTPVRSSSCSQNSELWRPGWTNCPLMASSLLAPETCWTVAYQGCRLPALSGKPNDLAIKLLIWSKAWIHQERPRPFVRTEANPCLISVS